MSSYTESKKKLDAIRDKYGCKGEVIFRTAIQYVIEHGQSMLSDEAWQEHFIFNIDKRHDEAEAEGKILFCTRNFEKAIFECAFELAQIEPYDFLIYIQREIYLGGDGISYQRAIELLTACIESIYENHSEDCYYTLEDLRCSDFSDDELKELGYGFLIDVEDEDDEQ